MDRRNSHNFCYLWLQNRQCDLQITKHNFKWQRIKAESSQFHLNICKALSAEKIFSGDYWSLLTITVLSATLSQQIHRRGVLYESFFFWNMNCTPAYHAVVAWAPTLAYHFEHFKCAASISSQIINQIIRHVPNITHLNNPRFWE